MPRSLVAEATATAATAAIGPPAATPGVTAAPTTTASGAGTTAAVALAASTATAAAAPAGSLRSAAATAAAAGFPSRDCCLATPSIVAICVVEVVLLGSNISVQAAKRETCDEQQHLNHLD